MGVPVRSSLCGKNAQLPLTDVRYMACGYDKNATVSDIDKGISLV